MASPQVYDRFFVRANGKLLGETDTANIEYQGEPIPVATFVKEFAGITPVPKHSRITLESFTPRTGFEFDAIDKYLKSELVTIQAQFGASGKTLTVKGFVFPPSIRSSATENTKMTFTVIAEAGTFV